MSYSCRTLVIAHTKGAKEQTYILYQQKILHKIILTRTVKLPLRLNYHYTSNDVTRECAAMQGLGSNQASQVAHNYT
jgi:hypothetical protein